MDEIPVNEEVEREIGEVQNYQELDDGLNTVYLLETSQGEYILKERTNENNELEWFKAEPKIYRMLEQDDIPSPEVNYADLLRESHDNAFYIMEKLEGENPTPQREEYSNEELENIFHQYGRILGQIHENHNDFQGYGLLKSQDGELKVDDPAEKWYWAIEGSMDAWQEIIEEEWMNPPELELPDQEYLGEILPDEPEPVLTHLDNRLDNLLIQDGEITGFIDWSHPEVGHNEYDLVRAEYLLLDWDLDFKTDEEKEQLRNKLYEGYEEVAELDREGFEERRKVYRYATTLWLMAGFPNWGADWSEKDKKEMEEDLKKRMETEKPH